MPDRGRAVLPDNLAFLLSSLFLALLGTLLLGRLKTKATTQPTCVLAFTYVHILHEPYEFSKGLMESATCEGDKCKY